MTEVTSQDNARARHAQALRRAAPRRAAEAYQETEALRHTRIAPPRH